VATSRRAAIALLVFAEVAALAVWFSAAAVLPALRTEFALTPFQEAFFTSGVQLGFVIGTLISALLMLADRFDPRRLFMLCALIAAAANLAILAVGPDHLLAGALRLVVGMCMAGIYPVGMKMVASWVRHDMGLLIGLLVGAVTLGSAWPHLIAAIGITDWRWTFIWSSLLAATGGLAVNFVTLGPRLTITARFDPHQLLRVWRTKSLRLANLGYLGHMWELYAMWAWIGLFLYESFAAVMPDGTATVMARLAAFGTVAAGAIGSLAGGWIADRLGRTVLTMGAMAISGACALVTGFLFGADPILLTAVCLIWGVAIVADSAQFSASVAELSEPEYVGTTLTFQTCLGFALTLVTIHLLPHLVDHLGWGGAFASLALGPIAGIAAMARLRAHPDSIRLAGGRR